MWCSSLSQVTLPSRPQFPHQHSEAGELKVSQGLSRAALVDSMVFCPRLESEPWGHGRKKELSDGGKADLWVAPRQWTQRGPPGQPPLGKYCCCMEKARSPRWTESFLKHKRRAPCPQISTDLTATHTGSRQLPWPHLHIMDTER